MSKLGEGYTVGNLMFYVKPLGGGAQEITALAARSDKDEAGTFHISSLNTSDARSLLKQMITTLFQADILEPTDQDDPNTFRVVPQGSTNRHMHIRSHGMKESIAMPENVIVEVKIPQKLKHKLTDKGFDQFMKDVSARFPDGKSLDEAIEKNKIYQTNQKRLQKAHRQESSEAVIEKERLRRATKAVGHLLRPTVYTLYKHGVFLSNDAADSLVFSLLSGFAQDQSVRDDLKQQTDKYVDEIVKFLIQFAPELNNDKALIDDLRINIGAAEQKHRGRSAA
jgi:hypothetical protein